MLNAVAGAEARAAVEPARDSGAPTGAAGSRRRPPVIPRPRPQRLLTWGDGCSLVCALHHTMRETVTVTHDISRLRREQNSCTAIFHALSISCPLHFAGLPDFLRERNELQPILLEVWRQVCRHIEVDESVDRFFPFVREHLRLSAPAVYRRDGTTYHLAAFVGSRHPRPQAKRPFGPNRSRSTTGG